MLTFGILSPREVYSALSFSAKGKGLLRSTCLSMQRKKKKEVTACPSCEIEPVERCSISQKYRERGGKPNHLHKALLSSQGTYPDDHQFSFRLVPLGRLGQLALRNGGSPERGSSFSRGIFCSCGPIIASCHSTATTC